MNHLQRFILTTLFITIITTTAPVQAEEIHEAVKKGDLARVKKLLNENPARLNLRETNERKASPLHLAVAKKSVPIVNYLLNKNATVDISDHYKQTPLHWATKQEIDDSTKKEVAEKESLEKIVTLFIQKKANVNAKDDDHDTPLHFAAKNSSIKVVAKLLTHNASVYARNSRNETALHTAVIRNDDRALKAVTLLIQKNAEIDATDNDGYTPLHHAIDDSTFEVFSKLIAHGANVNAKTNRGSTPLHILAYFSDGPILESVNLLIKKNVKIDTKDSDGQTPLHIAASFSTFEVIEKLIAHGANINIKDHLGNTLLHQATLRRDDHAMKIVDLLIQKKLTVNAKNNTGNTPFLHASGNSTIEVVTKLIAHGADINAKNRLNETALHRAISHNNNANNALKFVNLFISKKLAINAKNNDGTTPLHLAVATSRIKIITKLLAAGANVNAKDNQNHTPIFSILQTNSPYRHTEKILDLLIQNKAKINIKNNTGRTPIYYAVRFSTANVVENLLAHGADVTTTYNSYKRTLLHLAVARSDKHAEKIIDLLIQKKTPINAKDGSGYDPIYYAVQYSTVNVVEKLFAHGVKANAVYSSKRTLLHIAVTRNDNHAEKMIDLLIQKKLLINAKDSSNDTPLFVAIHYSTMSTVKKLIAAGANITTNGAENKTLLHAIADREAHDDDVMKLIDLLVQKKVSINAKDHYGNTPLHLAAKYSVQKLIGKLIAHHADVNAPNNKNETPLHIACQEEATSTVKQLLDYGANPNVVMNHDVNLPYYYYNDSTPLSIAAKKGHIEIVNLLLAKRANCCIAGYHGYTPLHRAVSIRENHNRQLDIFQPTEEAQEQYGKIVTALLKHGAQAERKTGDGKTAMQLALQHNNDIAVNLLVAHTKNRTPIQQAIKGQSIAHWACKKGLNHLIEQLIRDKQIADLTKKNSEGKTPLELACEGKTARHAATIKQLIAAKVPINTKNKAGETAAHIAAWNGNAKTIQRLLQHDKTLATTKDHSGSLPIHLAVWNKNKKTPRDSESMLTDERTSNQHTEIISALLKAGCNINATNSSGSTALHIAAWNGRVNRVTLLIQKKANLDAKNNDGLTPLHKAAWNGHLEIVIRLIAAGANPHAKDNDGYTAFTKANEQGKTTVANYLKSVTKK